MRVIIPVAGVGTRLRPHTLSTPKPLLPLAGRSVLAHIIELVRPLAPEEIVFVTGHLGHKIEAWVKDNCPLPSRCVRQETLLGLGYAVKLALDSIPAGPVLILLGDTLVDTDLSLFVRSGDNVIGVKRVEDPRPFGVTSMDDGLVVDLIEKPETPDSDLAAVGMYYISDPTELKRHLDDLYDEDYRTLGEIQLTDGLQRLMREGTPFAPYEVDGWYDCGEVEGLLATNAFLLERINQRPSAHESRIRYPVWIDETAYVTHSTVGPNVAVHAECRIEHSTLENCIIGEGTKVANSVIKDSLIAKNSVIKDNRIES